MGSALKVAPAALQSAAAAETAVGQAITGLDVGQPLNAAAAAMPGLQSGAASAQVAPIVDGEARAIGGEVGAHANKLGYAAQAYQGTDDTSAGQLNSALPAG
ncbi:hypothetical protein [Mycolicibacterium sp. HK-90]|uniref:type VII secretion target n=1 Tax=Mycolicibacterium sp. HK-90 TaxID=3056937 RepID=UPI002659F052|nr:hypothetical protein [Mycolicibacterium sp. HK-90]WKG03854.1 hypothetical protein QU592_01540 [Mycolicibacterium sp. HK-90]